MQVMMVNLRGILFPNTKEQFKELPSSTRQKGLLVYIKEYISPLSFLPPPVSASFGCKLFIKKIRKEKITVLTGRHDSYDGNYLCRDDGQLIYNLSNPTNLGCKN